MIPHEPISFSRIFSFKVTFFYFLLSPLLGCGSLIQWGSGSSSITGIYESDPGGVALFEGSLEAVESDLEVSGFIEIKQLDTQLLILRFEGLTIEEASSSSSSEETDEMSSDSSSTRLPSASQIRWFATLGDGRTEFGTLKSLSGSHNYRLRASLGTRVYRIELRDSRFSDSANLLAIATLGANE